ncbi:polysaccharide deacetylase [Vulgatibacter incomptus]|uniref:Polysaccharide deacetylase n=1 Tax=Vulgatibacter incomptus TaxID=1391653 RepID=A0A0K1PC25_9BACT|nr:polysaccharide deacetylase [Vulgatibacter incomptus]
MKELVASMLERSGSRRWLAAIQRQRAGGRRVNVVAWHRIVPDFEGMRRKVIPGMLTGIATFERQLEWLADNYHFATLDEAIALLSGATRSERDLCVLTFDDGYSDFLEHALPVLRRYGAPAVVYAATGHVDSGEPFLHDRIYRLLRIAGRDGLRPADLTAHPQAAATLAEAERAGEIVALERLLETRPRRTCQQVAEALERRLGEDPRAASPDCRLMVWDELRSVRAAGVDIGAHTIDHVCLPNEAPAEVERQLGESRAKLEAELGCEVRHFAYPNGWYSKESIELVARHGYRSAVTTEDRTNRLGQSPLVLSRKCVWEYTSRGLLGFSPNVSACNFDGTLGFLGLATWVAGDRSDAPRAVVAPDRPPEGGEAAPNADPGAARGSGG